jgi:hypothetical protein
VGLTVNVWDSYRLGSQRTTTTDADGNFRVRGLTPSLYFRYQVLVQPLDATTGTVLQTPTA